jgi:hypothetical protein
LKRAEIEDFRWHDQRHTAASYLAMNGASNAELTEFLSKPSPHGEDLGGALFRPVKNNTGVTVGIRIKTEDPARRVRHGQSQVLLG